MASTGPREPERRATVRGVGRALLRLPVYLWAAPARLVGLLLALPALVSGARLPALLARLPLPADIAAMTFGHVILGRDPRSLRACRRHERVHVRQYERWGLLFFPLYLGSSLRQWLRGRDPYLDNRFEVEAYRLGRR